MTISIGEKKVNETAPPLSSAHEVLESQQSHSASIRCTPRRSRGKLHQRASTSPTAQQSAADMTIKHHMDELEESPRAQKRSSPTSSSKSTSSPYFSTKTTPPVMRSLDDALPPYTLRDPMVSDADTCNYTTSAIDTASTTVIALDKMAFPLESVEEHIMSVTPVKTTAQNDPDADMLEFSSPDSTSSFNDEDGAISRETFRRLSADQRQQVYRGAYEDEEIEIQKFGLPDACNDFPELVDEILQAYVSYPTVTAKVWTNYDSYEKQFFLDHARTQDCGKIYLSSQELRRLKKLDPNVYQFRRVRLEIGTPFRTLVHVSLVSKYLGSGLGWVLVVDGIAMDDCHSPHMLLNHQVFEAMKHIKEDGLGKGQTGLNFRDLQAIAMEFLFKPKDEGELRQWIN